MTGVSVLTDPFQLRLDRMRRIAPLPLLAVSTVIAVITAAVTGHWRRLEVGAPLVVASAVLWTVVTARPGGSPTRLRTVFAVHTALAGVLVWVDLVFGVYAYIGFLFAYGLGAGWRLAGFAVTSLVVAASMSGGDPDGLDSRTGVYALVAIVMLGLVLNSSSITSRAIDQNRERGVIIDELAEANRRLEDALARNAELQAQLVGQAREAGVAEERQRLAGEIHDTLAQGLTGIIAQLQAAEQTRHRPGEHERHLAQAGALARSGLVEARRSVRALRPEQLEGVELPEALRGLVADWSARSGVHGGLDVSGTVLPLPTGIEDALFRVAQEALSNVAKHATAQRVRLTLTCLQDTVLLDVVDDGSGFDVAHAGTGYGLVSMRRRLQAVGGALTVDSCAGLGTTVNAAVPLHGDVRQDARQDAADEGALR